MTLSPFHLDIIYAKICPYCNSGVKLLSELQVYGKTYNKKRMIIACNNYPHCDSYVGTHDNGVALGRLANKKLRIAKKDAHKDFDKLWIEGYCDRNDLYEMLSDYLEIPRDYTHIGMFSSKTCLKVKNWSKELLKEVS